MTRALLVAALTLVLAPAAGAATSSTFASDDLTLTNDGDGETFEVTIRDEGVLEFSYVISSTVGVIQDPAGAGCAGGGTKTLTCAMDNIDRLILNLGAGDDTLTLNAADGYTSSVFGGFVGHGDAGDDTFNAGIGTPLESTLDGGADDDTFNGSDAERDRFRAEPGNDAYHGGSRPAPDPAPPGFDPETYQFADVNRWDEYRLGSSAPGTVSLDDVANDADGEGGTDNVGSDIESVEGGPGADTLTGGPHPAFLNGSSGDDTLTGGPRGDRLFGTSGGDTIRGGGGDDVLLDGYSDSEYRLEGDPPDAVESDRLDGGGGDDQIVAGSGADDVKGGDGLDTLFYGRVKTQVLPEPPEGDFAPTFTPLTVSLDDQPNDGATGAGEGANVHADVENVDTADAIDVYTTVTVGIGAGRAAVADDTLTGSGGSNQLISGGGRDTVDGGAGADDIQTGAGDDAVSAVDTVTDLIRCGAGTDAVSADLAGTNPARADVLSDCENVTGTPLGLEGGTLPATVTPPTKPALTLGGRSTVTAKAFLRRFTVGVGVTSDQEVAVAGELTTTQATIAKVGALPIGAGKLAAGTGTRTLKLKVAKTFRKRLKRKLRTKRQRRKGIKLSAAITATNAAGQVTAKRKTVRVKG